MLGFNVPVPVSAEGKPDYLTANKCAETIDKIFKDPALKEPTKRLSDEERECLVARFYEMCATSVGRDYRSNEQSLLNQGFPRFALDIAKNSASSTVAVAAGLPR